MNMSPPHFGTQSVGIPEGGFTRAAASQLLQAVSHSDSAFIVCGADARISYVNAGFTRVFGYTASESLGQLASALLAGPHSNAEVMQRMAGDFLQPGGGRAEVLMYTKTRHPLWVSVVVDPSYDERCQLLGLVCVLSDVTPAKMHEELQYKVLQAMAQELPLQELMELVCHEVERIAPEVTSSVLAVDMQGRLHPLASPGLAKEFSSALEGLSIGPQAGSCGTAAWRRAPVVVMDIASDPLWAPYKHMILPYGFLACWSSPIMARDGRVLGTFAFYFRENRGPDPLHQRLVNVCVHLCALAMEREESLAHIHQLAFFDALTGLPNRTMLRKRAETAVAEAGRTHTPLAVLFFNIDRFKQVNDTQGHGAGDALLREIAARLGLFVRDGDLLGRHAGDEFVAVLTGCTSLQATQLADEMRAAVTAPVLLSGTVVHSNASLGVAMFPEDGTDFDTLLTHADLAMYQAKRDGRGCIRFFNLAMDRLTQERIVLESALREALRTCGLQLHYQPQVMGQGGQLLHGVEALARWTHPELGVISPARFIPLAEESGLIDALGRWGLEEACRQMADWRRRGIAVPRVAVNLSARNFQDAGLPRLVANLLSEYGLTPSDLTLEMTESVMMDAGGSALQTIHAVHAMGVHLSLDDFGTGYSSLGYLHRLPIHELKLDKSFVQDLDGSAAAQALTNTVLRIGDGLRLTVVAEGVETQLQADFLTDRGCPVLQGYLFAKPLPAAELEQWLKSRTKAAVPLV